MVSLESVMEKLRGYDVIHSVYLLDDEQVRKIFAEEANTPSATGMPLDNRSLKESVKRKYHICIANTGILDHTPFHSIMMMGENDEIVGYDVTPEEKEKLIDNEDLMWISDDFFIDPTVTTGPVRNVLCPQEMKEIGPVLGIENAICMFISPNTDELVRTMFGIPMVRTIFTAIISFDL